MTHVVPAIKAEEVCHICGKLSVSEDSDFLHHQFDIAYRVVVDVVALKRLRVQYALSLCFGGTVVVERLCEVTEVNFDVVKGLYGCLCYFQYFSP